MEVAKLPGQRIFDLHLLADRWTARFNADDRGVNLTDDSIAWMFDGKADTVPLTRIVSVRLQFVSENEEMRAYRKCKIDFGEGQRLIVTDWSGTQRGAATPAYRAFVHDLHNRLVAYGAPSVRYLTGDDAQEARLKTLFFGASLLILACILLYNIQAPKGAAALLLMVLVVIIWVAARYSGKYRIGTYDPTKLPKALTGEDG